MGQKWILYSFVARGTVILAEHTTQPTNLTSIAAQWLSNLPADPQKKFTTKYDGHTFNYLVEDGYVYSVVAREFEGTQHILFEFLERIRQDFKKIYDHGKGDAAMANSLTKKFGPIMKQHMQWVVDHAEEIDKVAKVRAQISEVQVIISENVDKILERGQHLNSVVEQAEALRHSSEDYKVTATEIRRKMWYQNVQTKLVIFGILLLILSLIIWVSICGGFSCANN